jgi:hypothetical protein
MGKSRNILIINVSIVLLVIRDDNIINEYKTANINVYHKIDERKEKCQTPVLNEIKNQIRVIRYVNAKKTIITPPANFPKTISVLDTGFDKINSTVPFSSIEGINEDDITMNKVIIMKKGN